MIYPEPDTGGATIIGPVGADPPSPHRRLLARLVALVTSVGLVAGGVVLAVNAGRSSGGSDSPEAAVEELLVALSAEDLLGAAEIIEPSERVVLLETGVDITNELKRLRVLSEGLDLRSVSGIDMRFDNASLRSVVNQPGLAHVFADRNRSPAFVDVSDLPLGPLALDQAPADWLGFDTVVSSPISSTQPIVAVERGGRWYVSLSYSIAERVRVAAGAPSPSAASRPAAIGADSPEEAVERLLGELLRLDPRTAIGMLDPEEMAALYDYSPLFLDRLETTATDALQRSEEGGTSWSLDSIQLNGSGRGDFASVTIEAIEGSFARLDLAGQISMGAGRLLSEWSGIDFDRNPTRTEIMIGNGCTTVDTFRAAGESNFDSCERGGDDFAPVAMFSLLAALGDIGPVVTEPAEFTLVTHRVDDRWFVSPVRSGLETTLDLLRSLSPQGLEDTVEAVTGSAETMASGLVISAKESGLVPFHDSAHVADFDIIAEDIVNLRAPARFAADLAPVVASSILSGWLPDLQRTEVRRAVQIDSISEAGGVGVFVFQLVDEAAVSNAIDILLASPNSTSNGSLIEVSNTLREPVVATGVSDRFILAVGFVGTPVELLRSVIARQIPN